MKTKTPFVSIVIVNHNGKKYLKDCFDSLEHLSYSKNKLEIIMVDNCSGDDSVAYVKKHYPKIKIIKNEVNNYCMANNLGIKESRGEYVALLNNDIKVDKYWLMELVRLMEADEKIGAIGSKILFMDGRIQSVGHEERPNFYWVDKGFGEKDRGQYDRVGQVPSICACSVFYRKNCLQDTGLLDEDFNMYLEDVDLSLRCRKKGWKLFMCPTSIVYHRFHGTIETEPIATFLQEKNRLLLIAKHWPDRLPDALAGREYFSKDLDYKKEKDICDMFAFIYARLIDMHGVKVTNEVSPKLFTALRRILSSEKRFFIEKLDEEHRKLSNVDRDHRDRIARLQQDIARKDERTRQIEKDHKNRIDILESKLIEESKAKQQLRNKVSSLSSLSDRLQEQIKVLDLQSHELKGELNGIYKSTGFRYVLRPIWSVLWSIKQSAWKAVNLLKKTRHLYPVKFTMAIWDKVLSIPRKPFRVIQRHKYGFFRIMLRPFELFWAGHKARPSKDDKRFTAAYLSHIKRNTFPLPPNKLILMITSRCNLGCRFCDISDRSYEKKDMKKEDAFGIIDAAHRLGVSVLGITGGEPFLHKDIFEIIDYANSKEMKVSLTSNGLLIKENTEKILKSKIKCISVSIDGLERTHEYLRGSAGSYKKVLEGIEYIKKKHRDANIAINMVVTNKNVQELGQVHDYFKEKGMTLSFFPVINKPGFYLRSFKEKKSYLDFVEKIKKSGKLSLSKHLYYVNALKYFKNDGVRVRCLGLIKELGIDVEGNIFPCCVWENKNRPFGPLGNALKEDLEKLWYSEKFHRARKSIFEQGCGNCYDPGISDFTKISGSNFLVKPASRPSDKKKEYTKPIHAHIRLTSRCNFTCRHCDIWKNGHAERRNSELDFGQWRKIIDRLYGWLGPVRLDFAGGEILVRKDAVDIIQYSSYKGFVTGLTTNAFCIDEDTARRLVDSGLNTINISLDSVNPETHNYIRNNPAAFLRAKAAMEHIRRHRGQKKTPNICIATVVMEQNLNELLDLVSLTKDDALTKINFQAIDHNFGAEYDPYWYKKNEFWPRDTEKVNRAMDNLMLIGGDGARINNFDAQLSAIKEYFKNPEEYNRESRCMTAEKNIILDEYGNILTCWNMAPIGNILDNKLSDIWNSQTAQKRRKEILSCNRTCRILNCNFINRK